MKFTLIITAGLALTSFAQEMERLMQLKQEQRARQRAAGVFDQDGTSRIARVAQTKCVNGKAGPYACDKVDLLGFLSHAQMESQTKEGNDVWGWTSADGREFGAVGETDGTAFVEVLKDGSLKYLGRLPTQTEPAIWRDMKVVGDYVYIGSEAPNHGLQVFDMRKLLDIKTPKTFSTTSDLTALFTGFGSSHNIVIHEGRNMISAVGTSRSGPCKAGLFFVDITNPAKPTSPGCASQDGYVHDAQCVIYQGPDKAYQGKEICFNYNEDTLTIVDVTSKTSPRQISRTPYPGAAYTHQGWLTSPSHSFLLLDDELDEHDKSGIASSQRTTTYIFNVTSLAKPINTGTYQSPAKAIDHNQYIVNGLAYQSNYGSGLRIVDVSTVEEDPTGKRMKQVGFFDVYPEDDAVGGEAEFTGSWSVYPYFKSGVLLLNSIERGIFALRYTG